MATQPNYFHLHLLSDSTGETLISVSRAAVAQYEQVQAIEHVYPLVRNVSQLDRALAAIEEAPGIVLYTLVDRAVAERLERRCRELGCPTLAVLAPIFDMFRAYLGTERTARPGAQHVLDAQYFRRIDALNFTMLHDDGQLLDDLEEADVVLVGVSRTSKTPTSIYLANRGIKTANVPLVPTIPPPHQLEHLRRPLVVGLVASTERIVQIRQNRLLSLSANRDDDPYVDKDLVAEEIAFSRRFCARKEWPLIDVTRRSIEETAAAILRLFRERRDEAIVRA